MAIATTLHRTRTLLLILSMFMATIATVGAARAETVEPRPKLEQGAAWNYDISIDLVVSQRDVTHRLVQSGRLRLQVKRVDDEGMATVTGRLSRLSMMWSDDDGQVEFTWDIATDAGAERATSPDEALTNAARLLARGTIELQVAPDGRVIRVQGVDEATEALAESDRVPTLAMGIFGRDELGDILSHVWRAEGLVDAPRAARQGWQTERAIPMGPAGELIFVTDWIVEEAGAQTVRFRGRESAEVARPERPDETAPSMRLAEHEGEGRGAWSMRHGAISELAHRRRIATEWRYGDLSVPQTQTSRLSIRLQEDR
ncbi:MAG: hypothetical protein EA376_06630 [Phycisphaeraceae bacterium]|nr:MAG: hypothetical protein EA376_06630 [Phycisphaeraceae bacterium]